MKKCIFEFFTALVVQVTLMYSFVYFYEYLAEYEIYISINIVVGAALTLPFGSLTGIILLNRFVYKARKWNETGIAIAAFLSVIGIIMIGFMMDYIGFNAFYSAPLIVSILTVAGYNLG